jgi:regulator of protease activity HflC (stomatin/prohibitin superfamily)
MAIGLLMYGFLGLVGLVTLASGININKEWEQAVILRLGRYNRTKAGGLFFKWPFLESKIVRDLRTHNIDIEKQEAITKDNIAVYVDAVAFIKIVDSRKSVLNISDLADSLRKYAQTVLRNTVGEFELDDLLMKRQEVADKVRMSVDRLADNWGVDIENLELQNIELPEDMKRVMARQAEAEREKRGVIIAAEGEMVAADKLREASMILEKTKYAYALRQLQTISDVSQDQSNTIIFAPSDSLNAPILTSGISAKVPKPTSPRRKSR